MKNMLKNITMSLVVVSLYACNNQEDTFKKRITVFDAKQSTQVKSNKTERNGWKQLSNSDFIVVMPYATKDNFLKEKIYPCAKCYLRTDAANALLSAQKEALKKGLKIVLYDCYRPLPLQQKMFDIKPDTKYVADPKRGSKHNKGVAVDVGLADLEGNILDMGTAFDDFSDGANYHFKKISETVKHNRKLLRDLMLANGFTPYDNEWWHFNYIKTDYSNESFVWDCDE
jgi:zinc D-Ala-D-Ala dipeptidase